MMRSLLVLPALLTLATARGGGGGMNPQQIFQQCNQGGFRRALAYAGLGSDDDELDDEWHGAGTVAAIAALASPPPPPHGGGGGGGLPKMGDDCLKALVELAELPDKSAALLMVCSMGRSLGDSGAYYQCTQGTYEVDDTTKGFQYWKAEFGQQCEDCTQPHGGGGRRLQHHHHGGGEDQSMALCLPTACGKMDVTVAAVKFAEMLQPDHNISFHRPQHPRNHTFYEYIDGVHQTQANSLNLGGWIWLFILLVFGVFATAATVEHPYGLRPSTAPAAAVTTAASADSIQGGAVTGVPRPFVQAGGAAVSAAAAPPQKDSLSVQIMRCWDCQRNWSSLIRPVKEPQQGHAGLKTLNGIRVIAIASIALGHSFCFMPASNMLYAYQVVYKRFSAQTLIGNMNNSTGLAFNSVDTFFFLSGFLATWAMLEKYIRPPGSKPMAALKFVQGTCIHRFLRLTPLYAVVLMIYIYIYPIIGNGPDFGDGERQRRMLQDGGGSGADTENFCQKYWWTNLLYISNFYPNQLGMQPGSGPNAVDDGSNGEGGLGCMIQSWYLSVDMQLFFVALIAVLCFRASVWLAYAFIFSACLACWVYVGWASSYYGYTICDQMTEGFGHRRLQGGDGGGGDDNPDHRGEYQTMMYNKPWYHGPSYLVGTLLACVYIHLRDPVTKTAPKLKGVSIYLAWAAALFLMFYSNCWQFWATEKTAPTEDNPNGGTICLWSHTWDVLFSCLFRTWWCLGVAFMCYAALADQGGPIAWILGMHFWTPLSRLTFGVYMMHVMIIRLHFNTIEKQFSYTDYNGAYIFTANYCLSLAAALFMFLLVEKPMANLEMLLLAPPRRAPAPAAAASASGPEPEPQV